MCTVSGVEGAQVERRGSLTHFLPFPYPFLFRVVRFACLSFHEEMLELSPETKGIFSWIQWKLVECKFSFVLYICIEVHRAQILPL